MDRTTVFTKTAKGLMEATGKTSVLSRDMRALLKEVDGKATVGEVQAKLGKVPEAKLLAALQGLVNNDFIREFKQSKTGAPPAPAEADIDLDFTTAIPTLASLAKKAEDEARQKAQAAAEAAARAQAEAAARAKAEADAKAKAAAAAAAARARAEAERKAKEQAERERQEAEERARREAEAQARKEAEEFARAQEAARIEAEARAREEAERRAREEAERRAREAAERERQEAEERARREAEERARREAEELARAQAAARLEAEARAREEAERRARDEAERRAREEAERKAKEAAERERQEAEERARREAEERARKEAEEAERRAREDAERKAKEAAERERQEAEERARREAEMQARREAEEYAQAQEAARMEAERKAKEAAERERQEAEERDRREAEMQARREAEEYARAQEAARIEAEARSRKEAEETERRVREEAEEAERRAREEAEEAERKAEQAAERERQEAEEKVARESAQQPPVPAESGSSLDDLVRIETDFDAVLRASAGATADALKRSADADEALQKAAEEQARRLAEEQASREAEARAREEADAAAERAEEERRREDEERRARASAPDEAEEPAQVRDFAEAQALAQAQEAETERHFAEMEKELEAEGLVARGGEKTSESRELARKREQEEARERERAAAAALAAEAEAEEAPVRERTPVNWGRPTAIALFLILVLGIISIPFIPFDGYIPQFEKLAGAYLQQPVKIKTLHLMLLPQPHWRLDDVSVGNQGQLTVPRVNAVAELGSMFSDKKVFKSIELESPVLSEDGLLALLFGKPLGQDFKVARITATNAKLDSKTFSLPALDATIAVGQKEGTWQTIALETPDHNTKLRLTPDGAGAHVEVQTNAFGMPLNPAFVLENFDAKGVMLPGELRLSEFNGGIYGGYLSGSADLKWGADWSLKGEIKARAIDPGKLAQKLIEGGSVEGKAAYALQGKSYAALFAAPHLEGSFAVSRGTLLGVELGRFLQGGGVGGKTGFAELTGDFVRDAGKTQLRQIHLASGPLSASGNADADAGNRIGGRFLVEIKSSVAQARANLVLSGAIGEPHFSR